MIGLVLVDVNIRRKKIGPALRQAHFYHRSLLLVFIVLLLELIFKRVKPLSVLGCKAGKLFLTTYL